MGIYFNPTNREFAEAAHKEIYVDKSLLIERVQYLKEKVNKYICVSRPRRFGKSTDANMLVAYYSKGCDSSHIFDNLKIAQTDMYQKHLNQHNVIHLNMQDFLSKTHDIDKMLNLLTRLIFRDIKKEYGQVDYFDNTDLVQIFEDIYVETNGTFIFVIDEWDCIFREYKDDKVAQKKYLDFLRNLLKDKPYVELAYMTGILPIKKYGTHSALNMFKEISMLNPTPLEQFMGFTEQEVKNLCIQYDMNYDDMKEWYDGYQMTEDLSIYNHRSVVYALMDRKYENYWTSTETYEALQIYIDMNYDGLKDDVIAMMNGERIGMDIITFQNDMTTFKSKDDIYTLLVHLGYLGYLQSTKEVYIPNKEVKDSFVSSIKTSSWNIVSKALVDSNKLLKATLAGKEDEVARYIEEAHYSTAQIDYNNEKALEYTLKLAYYSANDYYEIENQVQTGKGIADLVFIPRAGITYPAMIIELKMNKDVESALQQIKDKYYAHKLKDYKDRLLLVGINYDDGKKHQCKIEKVE